MANVIRLDFGKEQHNKTKQDLVAEWFSTHRNALLSYATRLIPAHLCPEDIVQEVYLRILRHKNIYMVENPRAYLMMIAKNTVIDMQRKCAGEEAIIISEEETSVSRSSMSYGELLMAIEESINDLPIKYRDVFIMQHYLGMKTPEIARKLNLSERTIQKYRLKVFAHLYERIIV